jgi:hypothetical protein
MATNRFWPIGKDIIIKRKIKVSCFIDLAIPSDRNIIKKRRLKGN